MLVLTLAVTPALAVAASATPAPPPVDPVSEFVDELTAAAASSRQAAGSLADFQSLSLEDQAAVVEYASDPSVAEALGAVGANGTIVSHGGDVVTEATTTLTRTPVRPAAGALRPAAATAAAQTYNVTATYSVSQKILGFTLTKLTQTFKYVTGSNIVLRTTSCIATAVNYNFVINIDDESTAYMVGTQAQCDTVWKGYVLFKGAAIRMDKVQSQRVSGPGIVWQQLVNA